MNAKKLFASLFFVLLFAASGCTVRYVTAQAWHEADVLYTAYLEAQCYGGWCTQDTSKVKACTLDDDNDLQCKDLADAERALNPE